MKRVPSLILKKPILLGFIAFLLNLFISTTPILILHEQHMNQYLENFKTLQTLDNTLLEKQEKIVKEALTYAVILSILIALFITFLSHYLKKSYLEVENLSHFDGLTGLYNRLMFVTIFQKEIQKIKRNTDNKLFLVILDIDDFKPINDTFGHLVGDEAIKTTATTLQQLLRSSDTIARFGGDEFIICIVDENQNSASGIINRILNEFNNKTIPTRKQELQINLSIGYTAYKQEDDFKTMLHRADQALYISKEAGKNTATFLA